MRGNKYWKKEDKKLCRLCERVCKTYIGNIYRRNVKNELPGEEVGTRQWVWCWERRKEMVDERGRREKTIWEKREIRENVDEIEGVEEEERK